MKTIQEMLQELSQCIVTVSGEFRFRTNWNGGKVPQPEKPDLDTFDPNVPFCIENVGETPVEIGLYNDSTDVRDQCVYSYDLKTWQNYKILPTESISTPIVLSNNGDRVYIKASFHDVAPKFGATRFYLLNKSANTKIRARGNIASLNDVNENEYKLNYLTAPKYCYYEMFKDCTSLVQGPDLPATNLETKSYFRMFYGCTALVQAPNLPAEVLTESCYDEMFHKCTGLVTPPTISAKTLANQCCRDMFADCTSLTQAPALPATTLAEYCYNSMFARCASLTQAPELPATILAPACYYGMFAYCTSLTQPPKLSATTLANICYMQMFYYCTSLIQAPELPATTLANGCYNKMFEGCSNLTQAPELPAKWLREDCYRAMFADCTKLNYVKCLATDGLTSTGCTSIWLDNVSSTGTFECDNKKYFTLDSPSGIPSGWTITEINPEVEKPDLDVFDPNVPFCIENVGDVQASIQYNTKNTNIRISKDYKTWNDYTSNTEIELNPKDRVYIKSDYVKDTGSNPRFVFNGDGARLRARGNIASLIYGTNDAYVNKYTATEEHCYKAMFKGCRSLVQAPVLPATTLANYCYDYMFTNCASLIQAPELPTTTLANSCYEGMFNGCRSLTQAPELPATTLANYCYNHMFSDCTSLTQAPELPATTLANSCYNYMFSDCTSLTQAPDLPATTLASYCYNSMFEGCTSLVQAPDLPATTLVDSCYDSMFYSCTSLTQAPKLSAMTLAEYCCRHMFRNCTSLVQAPELPATTLAFNCYNSMFWLCKSLTQAPELPATTLANSCYNYMFSDCTSLTQAPDLPATTLASYCYNSMFSGCKKLNYVKCLATDTSATDYMTNWLSGVSSTGTFECDNKKYFTIDSPNGIPVGWTITEINPDVEKPDLDTFDPNVPFCIENVGDVPVEIGLYNYDKKNTAVVRTNCKVSYDLKTWEDYTIVLTTDANSVDINKITLSNKGDRVYIKADKNKIDTTGLTSNYIPSTRIKVINQSSETKIRARGNIASLNKGANDAYKTNYLTMSANDNLCYHSLFYDCTSLTQAPELPATKLLSWCYSHMFYGCTNLINAPKLPATTLTNYCYEQMFDGCTSLTQAPELPATTLANSCYSYMFQKCKNLTQAPELPAATLVKYCYIGMFWSCSKLNYVKCLATNISAEYCTDSWLYEVSTTGDFYTPAATNWTTGTNGIPSIWTRHDITE